MRKFVKGEEVVEQPVKETTEQPVEQPVKETTEEITENQLAYLLGDENDCLEGRIIMLNGEISDKTLETLGAYILKCNQEDMDTPVEEREAIKILINSPGGDVISGNGICSLIKYSTTPVYGVVLASAASMAFMISLHCHKVYALPTAMFLLHDGEVAIQNSTRKFLNTAENIKKLQKIMKAQTLELTKITSREYNKMYGGENYYDAMEAKEKGIVDYILGVDVPLDTIL